MVHLCSGIEFGNGGELTLNFRVSPNRAEDFIKPLITNGFKTTEAPNRACLLQHVLAYCSMGCDGVDSRIGGEYVMLSGCDRSFNLPGVFDRL